MNVWCGDENVVEDHKISATCTWTSGNFILVSEACVPVSINGTLREEPSYNCTENLVHLRDRLRNSIAYYKIFDIIALKI